MTEPLGWKAVPAPKLAESLTAPALPALVLVDDGVVVIVGLALVMVRMKGVVEADDEWLVSPP